MGQVVPFSRRALVLLVAELQQFSLCAYIDAVMYKAERRRRDFKLIFCDGSEREEFIIKGLQEGEYQEVWCFGEFANPLALSLCQFARQAGVSIHNFTRCDVVAHKEYGKYATHSKFGVY